MHKMKYCIRKMWMSFSSVKTHRLLWLLFVSRAFKDISLVFCFLLLLDITEMTVIGWMTRFSLKGRNRNEKCKNYWHWYQSAWWWRKAESWDGLNLWNAGMTLIGSNTVHNTYAYTWASSAHKDRCTVMEVCGTRQGTSWQPWRNGGWC